MNPRRCACDVAVKLTQRRADVLAAIRDTTKVHLHSNDLTGEIFAIWQQTDGSEKVVTAIARWLEDHQLIRFGEPEQRIDRRQAAVITIDGRAALNAHDRKEI